MLEPLAGWRHVAVTGRRTRRDFAECLRALVEERYPDAEHVRLVINDLIICLREPFAPDLRHLYTATYTEGASYMTCAACENHETLSTPLHLPEDTLKCLEVA